MRKSVFLLWLMVLPFNLFGFKVTVYDLSEEDSYFNARDIDNNKGITLRWTSNVKDATYYINIDSSIKSPKNQVASGPYSGGDASYTIYASDILSHANSPNDGDKEIYVLIEAQESEDTGSSSPKFQENIRAIIVHFDRVPPPPPSISSIVPGENSLYVYLSWGTNSSESDKYGFNIYWRKKGTSDEPHVSKNVRTTTHKITGLTNNIDYEIWAEQIDKARNISESSSVVTGTPREVLDYYEYYKKSGGKEEGGFCFIATAVYGSPVNSIVYIFKAFRDTYLEKSKLGRWIMTLYYRFSPDLAEFIKKRPLLRFIAILTLTQIALILYLTLKPLIPLSIAILFLIIASPALRNRLRSILLILLLCVSVPLSLHAESEKTYGVSLNIGDYKPSEIDNEEGLATKPYKDIFNDKSELMVKLGFDYKLFQGFGTLSIGSMCGFWQVLGKGIYNLSNGTVEKSRDTTVFNILPLELNLIYRFDYYMTFANIPFVPYLKGGLDYYVYWITDSKGDISRYEGEGNKRYEALGGKTGYHYALGLMFLLDWIDRETASDFDMEFGVNNSFIFIEYYESKIDDLGEGGFNLSNKGLFFGLYLDI
ncbi:MAG: fibronectin type III domain-containing protein [Deltaproteobacteria bacterium]|nr:fibronectin type III domain-containing protein [Deltaproteobacteria bacterium]